MTFPIPSGHPGYTVNTAPDPSGAPAKKEAEPTMANATVAFDLVFTDGSTETVEAVSVVFTDGVVSFADSSRSVVASYNQELLRGWKPVSGTDRPALVTGAYTFTVSLVDGTVETVVADGFAINSAEKGEDDALLTYRFTTNVSGSFREELTIDAALVKSVARTEAPAPVTASA
jgi:hypothetical protein